jgi:hypothetical protein
MELELEPLEVSLQELSVALEPLQDLSMMVEPMELALEPLALVMESPLGGYGSSRFDRIVVWTEDDDRFVVMWRGAVDIGTTVDAIAIGEAGELVVDERSADGRHRRLRAFADENGEVRFAWSVDGETTTFDEAGRAWLQLILDAFHEGDSR